MPETRESGPASVVLRPVFPKWLRRLDPLLEAEDTNPLFEAFRLRSSYRRRSKIERLPLKLGWLAYSVAGRLTNVGGILLYYALCVPLLMGDLGAYLGGFVFVFLALPLIYVVLLTRFRLTPTTLPETLGSLLLRGAWYKQAAIDLWMVGVPPREIVEALYLESKRGGWRSSVLIMLAIPTAPLGLYFFFAGFELLPGLILIGAAGYLTWELLVHELSMGSPNRALSTITNQWELQVRSLAEKGRKLLYFAALIAIGTCASGLLWEFLGKPAIRFFKLIWPWLTPMQGALLTGALLVALGLLIRRENRAPAPSVISEFEKEVAKFEALYSDYSRKVIFADPDWKARTNEGSPHNTPPTTT